MSSLIIKSLIVTLLIIHLHNWKVTAEAQSVSETLIDFEFQTTEIWHQYDNKITDLWIKYNRESDHLWRKYESENGEPAVVCICKTSDICETLESVVSEACQTLQFKTSELLISYLSGMSELYQHFQSDMSFTDSNSSIELDKLSTSLSSDILIKYMFIIHEQHSDYNQKANDMWKNYKFNIRNLRNKNQSEFIEFIKGSDYQPNDFQRKYVSETRNMLVKMKIESEDMKLESERPTFDWKAQPEASENWKRFDSNLTDLWIKFQQDVRELWGMYESESREPALMCICKASNLCKMLSSYSSEMCTTLRQHTSNLLMKYLSDSNEIYIELKSDTRNQNQTTETITTQSQTVKPNTDKLIKCLFKASDLMNEYKHSSKKLLLSYVQRNSEQLSEYNHDINELMLNYLSNVSELFTKFQSKTGAPGTHASKVSKPILRTPAALM